MLVHLTKTVGRENPDTAKYAGTFNLDDLTSFLLKEYEEKPHSSLDIHSHKSRGVMRRRAITNLKLHLLFRSDRLPANDQREPVRCRAGPCPRFPLGTDG